MTASWALMGGIVKILQLPATNTAYLVGFRGHRKSTAICGKFAAVSLGGIWKNLSRKTVVLTDSALIVNHDK